MIGVHVLFEFWDQSKILCLWNAFKIELCVHGKHPEVLWTLKSEFQIQMQIANDNMKTLKMGWAPPVGGFGG